MSLIRCCVNKTPPHTHRPLASHAAHALREDMALVTDARWRPGQTLRIRCGDDVTRDLRDELAAATEELMRYANVKFTFVGQGDAEIRVAANQNAGSWCYIGTGCLQVAANEPTTNLGWHGDLGRTIHELCHGLGMIHEHQNPLASIPWNVPAVYAWYRATQGWSDEQIYQQVLAPATQPLTNGGYDRLSIMEYPIAAGLVLDPSFATGWHTKLSDPDKGFLASILPGVAGPFVSSATIL